MIRPAGLADMAAVTAIYAHAVRDGTASYELTAPDRLEMQARFEAIVAAGYPYLVIADGEEVFGYAYAGPFRPRPAYRFTVEDSVYLRAGMQGKGLGRQLLQRLVDDCAVAGFRQMVAVIGDGAGNQASIRLHEALGFGHAGTLVGSGFKHGRWLDTVFMQRALDAGASVPPDSQSLPERRFRGEL
jgi:phosphinothricin acetyltransferase